MKRFAYGPLGLKPSEFWSLTLKEFTEMVDGYKLKDDLEWRKVAQLAAWVTAPHMKRPVTAEKLLKKQAEKKKTTQEKSKELIAELEAEFETE